jgi:hypothetical protein
MKKGQTVYIMIDINDDERIMNFNFFIIILN